MPLASTSTIQPLLHGVWRKTLRPSYRGMGEVGKAAHAVYLLTETTTTNQPSKKLTTQIRNPPSPHEGISMVLGAYTNINELT